MIADRSSGASDATAELVILDGFPSFVEAVPTHGLRTVSLVSLMCPRAAEEWLFMCANASAPAGTGGAHPPAAVRAL